MGLKWAPSAALLLLALSRAAGAQQPAANQTAPAGSEPKLPLYMRALATLSCAVIFAVGVCGNLLVPLVVVKTKYLRNSTNLFLINLSVADLLVLTVCMPTVLIELHSRPETWPLGEPMCKLSNFVEMFAANGSIFTILAISFERYYAICKPLKAGYKCTRLRATIIICIIWLLSCVLTSPILIMAKSSETIYIDGSLVYNCILETDSYWPKMYVFVSMFAFFCLPLVVLMLVYCLIGRRLVRENLDTSAPVHTAAASRPSLASSCAGRGAGQPTQLERLRRAAPLKSMSAFFSAFNSHHHQRYALARAHHDYGPESESFHSVIDTPGERPRLPAHKALSLDHHRVLLKHSAHSSAPPDADKQPQSAATSAANLVGLLAADASPLKGRQDHQSAPGKAEHAGCRLNRLLNRLVQFSFFAPNSNLFATEPKAAALAPARDANRKSSTKPTQASGHTGAASEATGGNIVDHASRVMFVLDNSDHNNGSDHVSAVQALSVHANRANIRQQLDVARTRTKTGQAFRRGKSYSISSSNASTQTTITNLPVYDYSRAQCKQLAKRSSLTPPPDEGSGCDSKHRRASLCKPPVNSAGGQQYLDDSQTVANYIMSQTASCSTASETNSSPYQSKSPSPDSIAETDKHDSSKSTARSSCTTGKLSSSNLTDESLDDGRKFCSNQQGGTNYPSRSLISTATIRVKVNCDSTPNNLTVVTRHSCAQRRADCGLNELSEDDEVKIEILDKSTIKPVNSCSSTTSVGSPPDRHNILRQVQQNIVHPKRPARKWRESHHVVDNRQIGPHGHAMSELLVVQDISKKQQMDSRRQVVVMLAFVVACFFLLFFPYRVFTIWLILSTEDQVQSLGMETYYNLTYFSRILIYLHSAINPIAYNLISTKFRRAFISILLCRGSSSRRHFTTEHRALTNRKIVCNEHKKQSPRKT